jgi:hypothetical protein
MVVPRDTLRSSNTREYSVSPEAVIATTILRFNRPQQQYGGYPPQAPPSPQPPYNGGYGQPTPPQQYGGYQQVR